MAALRLKQTRRAARLIEERARAQAKAANRAADLMVELNEGEVSISEEYLARIVDEVVQNAFKFSEAGTSVKLEFNQSPRHVTLIISDRGRGFSTEHISRIGAYMQFDRKIQEQQGQGLGLSIAKRLTELHGGTLSIQKAADAGTAVTIKLPKPAAPETQNYSIQPAMIRSNR